MARDQRISFTFFGADSVRNAMGLWSEYSVTGFQKMQCFNFCDADIVVQTCFSTVAQFCCVRPSLLLAKATGRSWPSMVCVRHAPIAKLLASMESVSGIDVSITSNGFLTTSHNDIFKVLNALRDIWWNGLWFGSFLPVKSVSDKAISLKPKRTQPTAEVFFCLRFFQVIDHSMYLFEVDALLSWTDYMTCRLNARFSELTLISAKWNPTCFIVHNYRSRWDRRAAQVSEWCTISPT